jgi:hypothetical protein
MAANLAVMATNAVRNFDIDRALELLEQIRVTCDPDSHRAAVMTVKTRTRARAAREGLRGKPSSR